MVIYARNLLMPSAPSSTVARPILVTGAAGFIGCHVVRELVDQGDHVIAMVRTSPSHLFDGDARVREVCADVTDLRAVIRAARGATRIVHLAGMTSLRGLSYDAAFRTNAVGMMNVLDAARLVKAERLIVLGTQSENTGAYARTKREADELVLASDVPHVVLRPSLVYGPSAGGVFGAVAAIVRKLSVVPLIGGGRYPMAPVYVDDVTQAIREALARPGLEREYYLSGPEVITFRRFVSAIAAAQHRTLHSVSIPYPVAALGIGLAEMLHVPLPVTSDTLRGLVHPRLHDPSPAARDLGLRLIHVEEGLRRTFGGERSDRHARDRTSLS